MAKLNWSVQLVEISRSEFWYKKLAQIPIGSYESYLKLVVQSKNKQKVAQYVRVRSCCFETCSYRR